MKPALIIGSTCVDVIINVDHLPSTEEDIHPTSQTMSLGGCAYNVSCMMRLLGSSHTFISPVGGGIYGDYVAKQLKTMGIPVAVRLPEIENGCCYCLVEPGGERTFMSYHGAEYTFQKAWMEPYDTSHYGLVYICGLEIEEPTGIHLIEYLEKHRDLEVFFSPGPRSFHMEERKLQRMFALRPILHVNSREACSLAECDDYQRAAHLLRQQTRNTVIVTLGSGGAYCLEQDSSAYLVPPTPVAAVADTIGAGDAHVGTILSCLTKDMPLRDAIAYANQVAAAVVGVKGGSLTAEQLPACQSL